MIASVIAIAVAVPTAKLPMPGALRVCVVGWVTEGPMASAMRWSAVVAIGWLAVTAVVILGRRARFQHRHPDRLPLVADHIADTAWSIEHPEALVYWGGGRRPVIATTTAAAAALAPAELGAVLAHERAHLAGRQIAIRAVVEAVAAAWPCCPPPAPRAVPSRCCSSASPTTPSSATTRRSPWSAPPASSPTATRPTPSAWPTTNCKESHGCALTTALAPASTRRPVAALAVVAAVV